MFQMAKSEGRDGEENDPEHRGWQYNAGEESDPHTGYGPVHVDLVFFIFYQMQNHFGFENYFGFELFEKGV